MQTKTLSERIEELQKEFYSEYPHAKLSLNIQAKEASDVADLVVEMFGLIDELQQESKTWQEMVESTNQTNRALVTRLCEFGEEKDELLAKNRKFEKELFEGNLAYLELLAKNKELEEELKERKAYIVANPCAQCGGKINAMRCEAWAKKARELEEILEKLNKQGE
jgi:uncharacterized coiled-coil DUF342 family protein